MLEAIQMTAIACGQRFGNYARSTAKGNLLEIALAAAYWSSKNVDAGTAIAFSPIGPSVF